MVTERLTGEEIEELKQLGATHFWPHARMAGDMSEETGVQLVSKAEGVWVEEAGGKRWSDMVSGMWLKNIGHGRKEIADAVYEQMTDIAYSPGGTVSPATVKLAAKVASLAPDKDSRVYFVSGGSEAVETALKMAKNYQVNRGERNRWKVISRKESYHGATHATMALGASAFHSMDNYGPPMPGNIHVSQVNEYRRIYCRDRGGCNLECAREVDRAIVHEGPSTVAAFIGEPISVPPGVHIPNPEYWPTIRAICDKYGVVFIADEVITGFGRTGKMFAAEHWDIKPDIITVAKALTSGYQPIGAAIASKEVADAFIGGEDATIHHLLTFGGNPAACAAGLANLEIMENEGMVENSANMGDYLYEELQTLYEHRIVGDVRGGMGLLCGVELVKDRDTRESFPKDAGLAKKLNGIMAKRGLQGMRLGDNIMLAPPLCITKDEVDYLVKELDDAIDELEGVL